MLKVLYIFLRERENIYYCVCVCVCMHACACSQHPRSPLPQQADSCSTPREVCVVKPFVFFRSLVKTRMVEGKKRGRTSHQWPPSLRHQSHLPLGDLGRKADLRPQTQRFLLHWLLTWDHGMPSSGRRNRRWKQIFGC